MQDAAERQRNAVAIETASLERANALDAREGDLDERERGQAELAEKLAARTEALELKEAIVIELTERVGKVLDILKGVSR